MSAPVEMAEQVRPRAARPPGKRAFRWLLVAVFVSHFLVLFMKATSGFLPTSLTALLPTVLTLFLYFVTILYVLDRRLHVPIHLFDLVIFFFMALSLAQVFNDHITIVFGLRSWQRTAFFAGMYFVGLYLVNTPERAAAVVRWAALTIALAGLVAVAQSVFGLNLEGNYAAVAEALSGSTAVELAQKRSYGTLVSQASFGLLSALGVLLAMTAWMVAGRSRRRAEAMIAMGLCAAGLLLSGTRSAMLGLAVGILPLLWLAFGQPMLRALLRGRLRKDFLALTITMALAATGLAVFVQTSDSTTARNTLDRLRTISPAEWLEGDVMQVASLQDRIDIWQPVLFAIRDRPLLGYGTGILGGGSESTRVGVQTVNGEMVADNQFLELWGELGFFGLLLYLIVLAVMATFWLRRRRPRIVYTLSLLLLGVAGLFTVSGIGNAPLDYYPANAFFWLLLGMGMNLRRFQRIFRQRAAAERSV